MIFIRKFDELASFFRPHSAYLALPDGKLVFVAPLYGPFNGTFGRPLLGEIIDTIDGSINDTPKDIFGERECLHDNVEGTIIINPWKDQKWPTTDSVLPSWKIGNTFYTQIVSSDLDVTSVFSYDGTGRTPPVNNQVRNCSYAIRYCYCSGSGIFAYGISYTYEYFRASTSSWVIDKGSFMFDVCKQVLNSSGNPVFVRWKSKALKMEDFDPSGRTSYTWQLGQNAFGTPLRFVKTGKFLDAQIKFIQNGIASFRRSLKSYQRLQMEPWIFGDLAQDCVDQQRWVDTNGIAFIKDLIEIKRLVPKVGKLTNPKTYANLFLWWKYGVESTSRDFFTYDKAIRAADKTASSVRPREYHASHRASGKWLRSAVTSEYHYKVLVAPFDSRVMNIIRSLREWGMYPSLEGSWDLLPYSFVVDWFADVSSALHGLDTNIFAQYYDVSNVLFSSKYVSTVDAEQILPASGLTGTIKFTRYTRLTRSSLHRTIPRLGNPGEFHNFAELTSLIVQKL